MSRQLTEVAQCAKLIRKQFKIHGIKARVTSRHHTVVNVTLYNEPPWVMEAIETATRKYQYGHFNGMEDIYEYSNSQGHAQCKFLFIHNEFDQSIKDDAWSQLKELFDIGDRHQQAYWNEDQRCSGYEMVLKFLNGSLWDYSYFKKPVVRYAN